MQLLSQPILDNALEVCVVASLSGSSLEARDLESLRGEAEGPVIRVGIICHDTTKPYRELHALNGLWTATWHPVIPLISVRQS